MSCDRSYGVELFAANEDDAVFWTPGGTCCCESWEGSEDSDE